MKLDEVIPYIENMNDVYVAKILLELESNPNGYYHEIYDQVNYLLRYNISDSVLIRIFKRYEEHKAIKYIQYFSKLYDEIKDDKKYILFRKQTFLKSILDIPDIDSLKLYLNKMNEKLKGKDINYNSYVPVLKLK